MVKVSHYWKNGTKVQNITMEVFFEKWERSKKIARKRKLEAERKASQKSSRDDAEM